MLRTTDLHPAPQKLRRRKSYDADMRLYVRTLTHSDVYCKKDARFGTNTYRKLTFRRLKVALKDMNAHSVAILGATGAVGTELLQILDQRNFPISELRLLASERSAGKTLTYRNQRIAVVPATEEAFRGIDFAFFSAGAGRSREFAPVAVRHGATVVDNSSAFRMEPDTPLVIPEINAETLSASTRLASVPNCSAIMLLMAVAPLRALGKIDRLIVSTYQSASGGGAALMQDLVDQTREHVLGNPIQPKVSPHPYAFNLFSHNTAVNPNGYNEEESKVIEESRKILADPNLKINVTCVRVPVLRAHTESVTIEFDGEAPSVESVREVFANASGVRLVDDRERNHFPMPIEASGADEVLVGRIRKDVSNANAICLMCSGDQLRKGAALTAVQIAEKILALRAAGYVSSGTSSQSIA